MFLFSMNTQINFADWSKNDVNILRKYFAQYIQKECYPSGDEIKAFVKKIKITRSVAVVKSKIQHLIKLKKM